MTTAEERAKELIFALEATTSQDVITSDRQRALITQAITQAENDKLEEAALLVQTRVAMPAASFKCAGETLRDQNGDEHFLGPKAVNALIESKAAAIRSLKKD